MDNSFFFFFVQVGALPLCHHSNEFSKLTDQYGFKALLCLDEISRYLHSSLKLKENALELLQQPVNCLPRKGGYQDREIPQSHRMV